MFAPLRFIWNATRGNRFTPWKSEYLKWRIETYSGKKAESLRARAAGQNVTVSDILTELEIAAAVARAVPAASVYAGLASMVIEATSQALAAESASAGQAIDLTTIQPLAAL